MLIELSKSKVIELLESMSLSKELKKYAFTEGLGNYETDDYNGGATSEFYFYGSCSEKSLVDFWNMVLEESK